MGSPQAPFLCSGPVAFIAVDCVCLEVEVTQDKMISTAFSPPLRLFNSLGIYNNLILNFVYIVLLFWLLLALLFSKEK